MTKLSVARPRDNQVEDLGPLAKQTELKLLMIERNKIKDLTPLVDAAKADADGPKRFAVPAAVPRRQPAGRRRPKQLEALKAAGVRIEG